MDKTILVDGKYTESLFEKVMGSLDDYQLCKLKLQQLIRRGNYDPSIECRIKEQLAKSKNQIEQLIQVDTK